MADGVKLTTVDASSLIDEVIATRDGSVVRVPFTGAAAQLASAGAVRDLVDRNREALEDDLADLSSLITTGVKLPLAPVVFRSTSTGALATAFVAGTVHDGHTAVAGERFLMDGRDDATENGVRTVPTSGAPPRATDADTGSEIPGTYFLVLLGTSAGGSVYSCGTPGPITLGTTVLKFVKTGQSDLSSVTSDIAALRQRAAFPFPAIDPKAWTSDVANAPANTTPISIGSNGLSIASGSRGRVIRATASPQVGPVALDLLEDGAVYLYSFGLQRQTNDPSATAPLLRMYCFDASMAALGVTFLPSPALAVADGFVKRSVAISLDAAKSDVTLFAGTRYVRPFINLSGQTTGVLDILFVQREASPAALVASGINSAISVANATTGLATGDTFAARRASDGALLSISKSAIEAWIKEVALADRFPYYFDASAKFGTTAVDAVASDTDGAGLGVLSIKNESKTAFISVAFGENANLFSDGSETYGPGAGYTYEKVPPGRVSVVSDTPSSPVTLRFWRSINTDPNSEARAEAFVAGFTASMTTGQRSAVKEFYKSLYNAGILNAFSGGSLFIGPAGNEADALRNWAGGVSLLKVGSPVFNAWGAIGFDGVSAALNSQIKLSDIAGQNDHTVFVYTDDSTTLAGSSKISAGDASVSVGPNRTVNSSTMRSASNSSDVVTVGGAGGLQMITRTNSASYITTRNDVDTTVTRESSQMATVPVFFGAQGSVGGGTTFSPLPLKAGGFGRALTRTQREAFRTAFQTFKTAVGA